MAGAQGEEVPEEVPALKYRTITVDCNGWPVNAPEPPIKVDDFIRTRTKTGGRFYLVAEVHTVQRRTLAACMRVRCLCVPVDASTWERREPGQVDHFIHWYSRRVPSPKIT